MSILTLIAAVARNGVIGQDNSLPWHLPEDQQHFRRTTLGAPVIMGRATWDSLPPRFRPLPGRRNIVLTRQSDWRADGAQPAHTLAQALDAAADAPRVFVIGGAEIYALALPRADELVLTEIQRDFVGDSHFPTWPREQFREVRREHHPAQAPDGFAFDFVTYRRQQADISPATKKATP